MYRRRGEGEISRKIELSAGARRDLLNIWLCGARTWGEERAQVYAEAIDEAIARLALFPEAGSPRRHKGRTYRRWRIGSHAILYQSTPSAVLVTRILHVRMLTARHLR